MTFEFELDKIIFQLFFPINFGAIHASRMGLVPRPSTLVRYLGTSTTDYCIGICAQLQSTGTTFPSRIIVTLNRQFAYHEFPHTVLKYQYLCHAAVACFSLRTAYSTHATGDINKWPARKQFPLQFIYFGRGIFSSVLSVVCIKSGVGGLFPAPRVDGRHRQNNDLGIGNRNHVYWHIFILYSQQCLSTMQYSI